MEVGSENYENLANAIILCALDDYARAFRKRDIGEVERIERFFYSEWYSALTDVAPEVIIKAAKTKAARKRKRKGSE